MIKRAFTIIELLVVIVIIGVLASVVIVSYSGLTSRASVSSYQTELTNASKRLSLFFNENNRYPDTINCNIADSSTNLCLKTSSGSGFTYYYDNTTSPASYDLVLNNYHVSPRHNTSLITWGSSPYKAGKSCQSLLLGGNTSDGVYWIDPDQNGANTPFQVYCDQNYSGGGWTLILKATRGTTFNYSSNYWTTTNTLNTGDLNLTDSDSKYRSFNEMSINDLMARWPDVNNGAFRWLQTSFNGGAATTLPTFFSTANSLYVSDALTTPNYSASVFSAQTGTRWYGFNYGLNSNARVRWGFAWNNEADHLTNDVSGGIGMSSNFGNYSAGDKQNCCPSNYGIQRSARIEIYGRNTADTAD